MMWWARPGMETVMGMGLASSGDEAEEQVGAWHRAWSGANEGGMECQQGGGGRERVCEQLLCEATCVHARSQPLCLRPARALARQRQPASRSAVPAPPCQLRRVTAPQAQATCDAVSSALLRVHFPGALVRGFRRLRSVLTFCLAALRVVLEAVAVAACGGDGANVRLGCLVG